MRRMQSYGMNLGNKYLSYHFVVRSELLGVSVAQAVVASQLSQLVPSLGIRADLSLVFDGVSIGATMFSRHETLEVIGVAQMQRESKGVWSNKEHMLAAPSVGQQHKGEEQQQLILSALAAHPARLTTAALRARLAMISADGAACRGGEDHIHTTTGAAELIWQHLHSDLPPTASEATEWDLFHRIDLAVGKAIQSIPYATAIFDVARVLNSLFGVGDGRVIYRATADMIGEKRFCVPDQGGSRKVIALHHTVEHLLKTHRTNHAAMHARIGQAQGPERRGGQTKQRLIEVGRRVSAVNFVTFLVGTADVLKHSVVPIAMMSQEVNVSSVRITRECREAHWKIVRARSLLERLRIWCFCSALLVTMLSRSDCRNLWEVLRFSELGRSFPRLVASLRPLIHAQEFAGCSLSVSLPAQDDMGGFRHRTVSPRCQCSAMANRQSSSRRVRVGLRSADSIFDTGAPLKMIWVPEWVAYSEYSTSEIMKQQKFPMPRFCRIRKETSTPVHLQGVSRFRESTLPLCVVPELLPAATCAVLEALFELDRFLATLAYHFNAYVLGAVGVNKSMREVAEHSSLCWDWEYLLRREPQTQHFRAFFALFDLMQPTLRRTEWPVGPGFEFVSKSWSSKRGHLGLFQQYQLLARRIRRAGRASWRVVTHYYVRPVSRYPIVSASLSCAQQFRNVSKNILACVFSVIGDACVGAESVSATVPFKTKPSSLAAVGFGKSVKQARQLRKKQEFRGAVGSFASLVAPLPAGKWVRVAGEAREFDENRLAGKLVRVVGEAREFDEKRLAASLHEDKSFVFPDASGSHCWHAVRLYLRCRARAPESACERWGSLLHDIWDDVAGWQAHRVVFRLFLRAVNFMQSEWKETAIAEISSALYHKYGLRPYHCRTRTDNVASDPEDDEEAVFAIRRSVREETGLPLDWWREQACPSFLLPAAAESVSHALNHQSRSGAMKALPLHSRQKDGVGSSHAEALSKWLRSEDASEWRRDRKLLFPDAAL